MKRSVLVDLSVALFLASGSVFLWTASAWLGASF